MTIYLDHASTSHPKPLQVVQEISDYLTKIGASPGRGNYALADLAHTLIEEVRNKLAIIVGAEESEQICFTHNATHAINIILKGLLKKEDHVIISNFEHNAVLRPLHKLSKELGVTYSIWESNPDGFFDINSLEALVQPKTKLLVLNHASNVLGILSPVMEVARMAKNFKIPLLVDVSQTAGLFPIHFAGLVDIATVRKLQASGISVYTPLSVDEIFLESGPKIKEILEKSTTKLIVQEVGGYLAGYTHELARYAHFVGIVEDTNNGHWRYKEAGLHAAAVISMAQSPIKDIEDTIIGDSVVYSIERVFREEFQAILQGANSGVIGYGKIGTSTSIGLRGRESVVTVYDIDPVKSIRARFEGYQIAPLRELLSNSDLIVGCTGKTSVREEDIPFIRDQSILVSASAKNEEFDLSAFDKLCHREELSPLVWRYTQKDGRSFYLLNRGTPINFRDFSILGYVLDMIYSELFLCMHLLSEGGVLPGLQHSPGHIHSEVAQNWLKIYEPTFAQAEDDKTWLYPYSLSRSLTRTFFLQTNRT